jgi:hypothetical protein
MGLEYTRKEGVPMVTVDRRLWLDADGRVVEDGDPAAAFLFAAGPGESVPDDVAEAGGYKPKAEPKPKRAPAKRKS